MQDLFYRLDEQMTQRNRQIPAKADVKEIISAWLDFLFPSGGDSRPAAQRFTRFNGHLTEILQVCLQNRAEEAPAIAASFAERIPSLHALLVEDAAAFLEFDPAATCIEEIIAMYPGFHAIAVYRMAHELYRLRVPMLPRFLTEVAHSSTGIDIHPGASVGHSFFIDHGTGVVIGATAIIGDHVKIYQGVTLGALQVDKSLANTKRHPTIEDHCVIYANSTILGGLTTVGKYSVIGGNTWLTESVPPYSVVLHQAQIKVRQRPSEEPINFVI
jgi:serine O-acetyltransferase